MGRGSRQALFRQRWIILTAFIIGMGLGIHRLNLLVIPALYLYSTSGNTVLPGKVLSKSYCFRYSFFGLWFSSYPESQGGWLVWSCFCKHAGLLFNSGLLIFVVVLAALLIAGIKYSINNNRVILNYVMTIFAVIMIGYSSYAMIMIRSSAKPR